MVARFSNADSCAGDCFARMFGEHKVMACRPSQIVGTRAKTEKASQLAVRCQSRQTADALAVRRTRDTQIVLRDKCMHNRWRFLFLWISANALGLPIGWGVSNAIGSPFGGLAYGAIVVLALPALASTHQGNQVATES